LAYISVISPVYRAENIVEELVFQIIQSVTVISNDFEIILVEDGSPDNSWVKIEEQCKKDKRVKGIQLSRNFGQHHAISAGLDNASGEWIIVMDCDLQDRPDQIPIMFHKAQEGYDIVLGRRHNRRDSILKKITSLIFHKVLSYFTGVKFDRTIANYGVYNRKAIHSVLKMRESIRYFPTMVKWVGFKSIAVDIEHSERYEGTTTYNLKKLLRLAADIMLAYSDKPLRMTVKTGMFISLFSVLYGIYIIIRWSTIGFDVMGYASIVFSIWFLGGIIISILGIVGLYIGKIFEGVKNRPVYIIDQSININ
jgi:polyisoprenyl-phosphate glycosyltransferase